MELLNVSFKNDYSMFYPSHPDECEYVDIRSGKKYANIKTKDMNSVESFMQCITNAMKKLHIPLIVIDPSYEHEYVLNLGELSLVFAENGDYIRVVNSETNEEILYNVVDEFIEEPVFVLGATMGCITPCGELI